MMNIKIDPVKAVNIAAGILGAATMIVSNIKQSNDQKALKAELKDEIMKDLLEKKD